MKTMKTMACIPLALVGVGLVALLGLAEWGCYRNCNPNTDKDCPCPPGACGPYPTAVKDAGADQ